MNTFHTFCLIFLSFLWVFTSSGLSSHNVLLSVNFCGFYVCYLFEYIKLYLYVFGFFCAFETSIEMSG